MKKKILLIVLVLALGLAAEVANADFVWGTPTNLGPTVNGSYENADAILSTDGVELYFNSNRPGGYGGWDIWVARRATINDDWGEPTNLGPTVNSAANDVDPGISADGRTLFFSSGRPGGLGGRDLWVTTRATTNDPWGEPVNLGTTVNSSYDEAEPSISADGLTLFFSGYESFRAGGYGGSDLWVTSRATIDDDWGTPVNLGPLVNTGHNEYSPSISANGLALFFNSDRPGGLGHYDLWVTTRKRIDDNWGAPVNLGPNVNSAYFDRNASISFDGSTLFFDSNRPGGYGARDLWQVSIIPIVDFNGDGVVDCADMCIMVDHWGTDEPLYDIGPRPFGDGIVDVQDMIVLAENLFTYPGAVAYWKLDETEGEIAYDSVGVYDGILNGVPTWQPTSGMIDGALELDGIDEYVSAPLMLDRANAVFSVFAWVKGGMPGQVVFSQAGASDWLGADTTNGSLMTELRFLGKASLPLQSQTVITDGNWHRIGLVWDGSNRILYVDDVEVASDTYNQGYLVGDLQIGAGKNLDPGTFWFGLIDDVRIYNRAITP